MASLESTFRSPEFFAPDSGLSNGHCNSTEGPHQDCPRDDIPFLNSPNIVGKTGDAGDEQHEDLSGKLDPIEPKVNNSEHLEWQSRGRGDFNWRASLSENGQELYRLLLYEMGDREYLPLHASEDGWDFESALDELRKNNLIDESDSGVIRLK